MNTITIPALDASTDDWFDSFREAIEGTTGMSYRDFGDTSKYGIYESDDGELLKAWIDESSSIGDTWTVGFDRISGFVVWEDGAESGAKVVIANDMPSAIAEAEELFGCDASEVNIVDVQRVGEAEYYGVAHAIA